MRVKQIFWTLLFFFVQNVALAQEHDPLPLIPKPASLNLKNGYFNISHKTIVTIQGRIAKEDAAIFNEQLKNLFGFELSLTPAEHNNYNEIINLIETDSGNIGPDSYRLIVNAKKISVIGKGAGILYGLQTLLQLIQKKENNFQIPCLEISDQPHFSWRGMHLDVCRHFFQKEFIKKYIDLIALYKMNTFHWHLTDDQGWRIEIKKYAKLTETGAWRHGSMIGPYRAQQFDSVYYGGYYSQDDIKEIVKYAEARHITIVPEIEMPGHSLAALSSYPKYSCTGGPFEVAKGWGVFDDVFCAGNDSTFTFLENVLDEVCELFPGKYIHIGGDECPKVRWKSCPKCQARIQNEHLKNENELQSYFVHRIEKFLGTKGKKIIGWDEILEGGLAPGAAVMSWRGTEGGIAAAREHHDVVMTPGSHCYFDHYQGSQDYEPLAIGGYTTVEKVYSYEPVPSALSDPEQKYILGAQGNVWTEYIATPEHVEYMALPRMCALAEVLWTPSLLKDSVDFQKRLIKHFSFLDKLNVNYSKAIYELKGSVNSLETENGVSFEFSSPFKTGKIFYTLDGNTPTETSSEYKSPLTIVKSTKVQAAYFENGKQKGNLLKQEFLVTKSTGKKITLQTPPHENYFGKGAQSLVDGIRGNLFKHGQNWLGWWGKDMEAIIDLGRPDTISKVTMDVYDDEPSWIYLPVNMEVAISDDGKNFTTLRNISKEEIKQANDVVVFNLGNQAARFIKVTAKNAGKIPDGKQGSGNDSWLFVDEISVE